MKRDWQPGKQPVLCSEHFTEDSFPMKYRLNLYAEVAGNKIRRTLLPDAVPTIHSKAETPKPVRVRGAATKRRLVDVSVL